jgi:anti-anti-sigma factor
MDLTITRTGSTLALVGSIDLVTRQALVDAGTEVLQDGDGLTLDLGEVDFMDSVGIGALVELSKLASGAGKSFVVGERSARVTRILEATGLDEVWSAEA